MDDVKNIYFNIGENYPVEKVREKILFGYENYSKVRMIFDLDGVSITNMSSMKKVKKIFEELGVEKLLETCIVSKEGVKTWIVKKFLSMQKTERPVRFLG
jgi:hypothetical protein